MSSIDATTRFERSWTSAFIRIERHLRGNLQPNESSSTGATIESQPLHHHYFGNDHLPPYVHMNATSDSQSKTMNKGKNSNKIMDEALSSIPRSSLATLNPQQHNVGTIISADVVLPAYADTERKKMMKAKKGQSESISPSEAPSENTIIPPLEPTTKPNPRRPAGSSAHLTYTPSISPSIEIESSPINPSNPSESLSKEERTATGVVTTSAIMLLALILFAAFQKNRKRHKSTLKLNVTDPALCENASVSSERSSTFLDEGDKMPNDSSYDSSITSKIKYPQELKPVIPIARRQSGVATHVMKLINASIKFTKEKPSRVRDKKPDETELFPSLSPYLVDEFSSNRSQSETALIPSRNVTNKVNASTIAQPVQKSRYSEIESDGETLLEESDRLAWRAALDLDYSYNSNLYHDKINDDRRPWRSHPYATVVANDGEERDITLSNNNTVNERGTITNQKSLDEMSMGSVDFINPDIVQQFKVVDQRLSEGFEQFRAVDQRLSDEFDKLEATLVKNGNATPLHKSDVTFEERSQTTTSVHEQGIKDLSTAPISTGLDNLSCSNLTPDVISPQQQFDCDDNSSIYDSDDDDEIQRRYQLPHLSHYFSKGKQQQSRVPTATAKSMTIADSAILEQSLVEEGMMPSHYCMIPPNPSSLLNLPKSSNGDSTSLTSSIVEPETDDDDILSTSNDDQNDEYCFQKIRSRFNNQH